MLRACAGTAAVLIVPGALVASLARPKRGRLPHHAARVLRAGLSLQTEPDRRNAVYLAPDGGQFFPTQLALAWLLGIVGARRLRLVARPACAEKVLA